MKRAPTLQKDAAIKKGDSGALVCQFVTELLEQWYL
jgi:hypothetical protein